MAKNQEERSKDKERKPAAVEHYCYYDGAIYSPGAYVKVDGVEKKLLYCQLDGTWVLKDPPD